MIYIAPITDLTAHAIRRHVYVFTDPKTGAVLDASVYRPRPGLYGLPCRRSVPHPKFGLVTLRRPTWEVLEINAGMVGNRQLAVLLKLKEHGFEWKKHYTFASHRSAKKSFIIAFDPNDLFHIKLAL